MLPDRVSRLLTAYVDGELNTQQRKALVRWLRRSPEARELLSGLQKDAAQLRSLSRPSLSRDFPELVLQAVARRQAESARPSPVTVPAYRVPWIGLASAAAVLLALGVGAYFYFRVHDPRQSEPLALSIAHPSPSLPAENPAEARGPAPSLAQANVRELLGPPVPEIVASSDSTKAIPLTPKLPAQAGRRQTLLASPIGASIPPFKGPDEPVRLVFDLRELVDETPRQQLHQALQKADSQWIELRCGNPLAGIERLRAAFQAQSIRFILDQDAQALVKLGMGTDADFAVYCEDITSNEVVMVLAQLGKEKPKGFHGLVVKAMPWENGQKVAHYLGIDSAQLNASKKQNSELGEPGRRTGDRQALVVAYTPGRPRRTSAELRRYLDNRTARRAGTIRVFLVLSFSKG